MNTDSSQNIAAGFVRPNLAAAVADQLRRYLTRADARGMLPGERDIARALEVGRPIVREALTIMEREGLILRRHGRVARLAAHAVASR